MGNETNKKREMTKRPRFTNHFKIHDSLALFLAQKLEDLV
jgi:hypothetical protein